MNKKCWWCGRTNVK